jgi:DNA-binding beta-propeller fold protein YncE
VPAGLGPVGLAIDPEGYFVFVANGEDVIQLHRLGKNSALPQPAVGKAVPTGARPIGIAVSRPRPTEIQ